MFSGYQNALSQIDYLQYRKYKELDKHRENPFTNIMFNNVKVRIFIRN